MTDHLEAASKAANRGQSYDLAQAQAHASVAMAEALENIGTAISCLAPITPRVTREQRDALAFRMAEWWRESPTTATGERFERVLDLLLNELGIDVVHSSAAATQDGPYTGPWPDLGKVPVVVEVLDQQGFQWKHIDPSGWCYWGDRGRWVSTDADDPRRFRGPFTRTWTPAS